MLLLQPVLYLFLLGGGLAALIPHSRLGTGYQTYLFPGMLMMTVQTPAIMVGIRLITDRQSGCLRELLMAPVHRSTLLLGVCAGAPRSPRSKAASCSHWPARSACRTIRCSWRCSSPASCWRRSPSRPSPSSSR